MGDSPGMAGFPVLVEGLPFKLDSVKSKLAIYFQSKKKSGGGECEIRAHPDQGKLLVYFKNEEVQKNVVKKEFHTVQLLHPEPVQLRVTFYECGSNEGSSANPIRMTANSNKEPVIEQNQLLTSSQRHNKYDQSPAKESPDPMEASVLESSKKEESHVSQLLVTSDGPLDTDVVAMYFERFVSDVEISVNDESSWFVTCPSSDGLDRIISQKQHKLGGKTLQVQIYDKDKEDEKYEPRTFLLRGFDVHSRLGHISLYIDSLSNSTKHHIEPLQDGETVAVTFETDIDVKAFLRNCRQKPFENHPIIAQRLAKTNSVLVEGIHPSFSNVMVDLYFSSTKHSGGGEIKEIVFNGVAMTAIIYFQDHEAVRRVTERKHLLKDVQLTISRYYHDLQLSLYGNNGLEIKQPEQFDMNINPTLLNYIQKTPLYKKELDEIAKNVYCNITFTDSPNPKQMILKPSFDMNILLCYKIAKDWKKHAEEAIWKFIGKFDVKEFPADEDLWEKVMNKSRGLKAPGFDVLYCATENKVVIVGEKSKVLDPSRRLQEILEKAGRELEVERNTVEEQILMESLEELEFIHHNVNVTVSSVQISTSTAPPAFKLKGLKEEVDQVHKIIGQFQSQLERKPLNQSSYTIDFIKSLELKQFVQTHFTEKGITATLVQRQSIELVALKADVKKGEDKIKQLFQEVRINFTPEQAEVAEGDKWKRFLDDLKFDLKSREAGCRVIDEKNQAAVIIVGYSDIVSDTAKIITSYLDSKTVITQIIPATLMQVDYMESFLSLTELPEIQNKEVTISYIRTDPTGLKISGAAEHIKEAVSAIEDKLLMIQSITYTYNKPGEATALSKHKDVLEIKAKAYGCSLLIKTKEEDQSSFRLPKFVLRQLKQAPRSPIPLPRVLKSTPTDPMILIGGVTIKLKKGDITQEITDAIVNSTNITLDLTSGVSGAILKAAGSSVKNECKALGTGQQPTNGVVVTSGGQLQCKYIVQMVGPKTAAGITVSVYKVLEKCEKWKITTVAIPAIGTGKGGISCTTAINAILSGMENYFSAITSSNMKAISIVAFETFVYDSFADAFNAKKLNSNASTMGAAQTTQQSYTQTALKGGLLPTQLRIHEVLVEVKQGDITLEGVKGIVNSTNTTLDLNSGVSRAIFAAAGSAVTDECKKLGSQPGDGVVVTGSGNLSCDYIIHMVGQTNPALLTASVEKVLQECEKYQIISVSFPALGTGVGGMKPQDAIESMLTGFGYHLSQNKPSVIRHIYIVAFERKVYDVFLDVFQRKSQQLANPIEIKIGKVKVIAVQGDITEEQTDAIVNLTNINLNRDKGISGAILKAAGQSVVDDCSQLGVQSNDSVTSTKAGNLQVKYILHLAGWIKMKNTKGSIGKVLKECEKLKISSVSFPALGTGEGKLNPIDVANALLDAISDYVIDFLQPSLSVIRIILFNPMLMDPFRQCMEQRFRSSQPAAQTVLPLKPLYAIQPVYPTILRAAKHLIGVVEIYGITKNAIDKFEKDIEKLIKENCGSKVVSSIYADCLSDDEKQQIEDLCNKHQLKVEIEETKITIDGYNADILESIVEVNSMLQAARGREDRKQEETQLMKSVQWEFVNNEIAQSYDQSLNLTLEKAYQDKKKTLAYMKNGELCTFDFDKLQEKDSTGNVVEIKRRRLEAPMFELPTIWTNMNNQEVLMISLQSSTTEYKDVAQPFRKSCGKTIVDIVKIDRIQNRKLWQSYSVRKEAAERKNPGLNVEQILYHGTTKEIADKVNKTGFNRSFCGRNATAYGKGTYFALNASYSCDNKYSNPDVDGCKYIYQARAITAKKCKGQQDMLEPAPINAQIDPTDLCDCAVDDVTKPSIFVIFCDDGAYPEYLITFKTRIA